MKSLNFKSALKSYAINGDENNVIQVNTADVGIFERAAKAKSFLSDVRNKSEEIKNGDGKNAIEVLSELDKQVREQLNYIFGTDVSTPAFGTMNCLTFVDGVPVFVGFLNALLEEITTDVTVEQKKAKDNIAKYVNQVKK
ncbi:MAG: hypothetical protein J1E85_09370 [Ruminococcus sp.]|nr:hypothetical protein [Ruminococcus sp.]